MKIIIMSCSNRGAWYRSEIGKVFNVCSCNENNFTVRDKKRQQRAILKADCEVVEK